MSKIEAYLCDRCNKIKRAEEVSGLRDTQDMFDPIGKSFPVFINNPEKADIHFCLDCYRTNVLIPAENLSNRNQNEAGYQSVMKELAYAFKTSIITMFNKKKIQTRGKSK